MHPTLNVLSKCSLFRAITARLHCCHRKELAMKTNLTWCMHGSLLLVSVISMKYTMMNKASHSFMMWSPTDLWWWPPILSTPNYFGFSIKIVASSVAKTTYMNGLRASKSTVCCIKHLPHSIWSSDLYIHLSTVWVPSSFTPEGRCHVCCPNPP